MCHVMNTSHESNKLVLNVDCNAVQQPWNTLTSSAPKYINFLEINFKIQNTSIDVNFLHNYYSEVGCIKAIHYTFQG